MGFARRSVQAIRAYAGCIRWPSDVHGEKLEQTLGGANTPLVSNSQKRSQNRAPVWMSLPELLEPPRFMMRMGSQVLAMRTRIKCFSVPALGGVEGAWHCCVADGGDEVNSKPARLNPKRAAPEILQDLIATGRFPVQQGSNDKGNGADGGKSRSLTPLAKCASGFGMTVVGDGVRRLAEARCAHLKMAAT